MIEVVHKSSTNGRWGLVVVAPAAIENLRVPHWGTLTRLGAFEGRDTYQFIPGDGPGASWYLLDEGETEAVAGATVVCAVGLQSYRTASIVALGGFGVVRRFGYKGRSSTIAAFRNGVEIELPASVLAAMGLLPIPDAAPVVPGIPELEGPLAAALRKAGLA